MKKRVLVLVICICLLIGTVVSVAGADTQINSLVSQSYLNLVYRKEVETMISGRVAQGLASVRNFATQALDSIGNDYLKILRPAVVDGVEWSVSADPHAQLGVTNDTIRLDVGSGLVWTEGSASFTGLLIDVTTGEEVRSGTLKVNHRYIAPEQVLITVTGAEAAWSVEGRWVTTGEDVFKEPVIDPVDPPAVDPVDPPVVDPVDPPVVDPVDPPEPAVVFADVPEGIWYYSSVYYVTERGLFQGTGNNNFSPNMTMTRSMLTTVLHRMAGSPEVIYTDVFTDVPDGMWYSAGTVWAGQNGVATPSESGEFYPNDAVTRDQIAQMLYNYANLFGYDTTGRGDLSGFVDADEISHWAIEAYSWAVSIGLYQGNTQNQLMPSATADRAQIATLLQRFDLWLAQ